MSRLWDSGAPKGGEGVEVLVIPMANPLLIGIYRNGEKVDELKGEKGGYTSDQLPRLMEKILETYRVTGLYYLRGPGSYLSIKLTYLFLKTLQIVYNIPFKGAEGFPFSENGVIKGVGGAHFVKKEGIISLVRGVEPGGFKLPEKLDYSLFSEETAPLYFLKAV